jgi:hypothetical protein
MTSQPPGSRISKSNRYPSEIRDPGFTNARIRNIKARQVNFLRAFPFSLHEIFVDKWDHLSYSLPCLEKEAPK